MPFGFGGSSSRSNSASASSSNANASSFDNLDSFGFGGSDSRSRIAFEDVFANLFGGASDAARAVDTSGLTSRANLLFSSGQSFLDDIGGGGVGREFLEGELANSDGLVGERIGQLGGDLGEFLNETILPAIKSSGVQAGTLGGGRGEVSKGIAAEGLIEEFARGSTAIRGAERDRLTGIASGLSADNLARNSVGLDALPGLFGLAEGGAMAGLSPFAALASILGNQTVLQDSTARDFSSSTGRAGSESTSTSRSTSSSSSRGNSFNFGFGD